MVFEFKLPDIGEGIHEGEIVEWLVSEGDQVEEDQDIVEVMTDKATVQISSPRAGTVDEIRFADGETVNVGEVIITIAVDGEPSSPEPEPDTPEPEAEAPDEAPEPVSTPASSSSNGGPRTRTPDGVLAPPSVRIRAREQGIDLTEVEGSEPGGRVSMADLEAHQPGRAETTSSATVTGQAQAQGFDLRSIDRSDARAVEPMGAPLASPKAHAARAKAFQAHFSYVLSLDASKLVRAVEEAQPLAAEHEVTVDDEVFVLKAVAQALADHRRCNALVDEENGDLIIPEAVHLSVARHTEEGLRLVTVPEAASAGIIDIAAQLQDPDEVEAQATTTVTTLGGLGGWCSTPVLVHPQVTGVSVGALHDVARFEDGKAVPGKELTLSFSFDHRYVDGYDGAQFAKDVARLLEDPSSLLLGTR